MRKAGEAEAKRRAEEIKKQNQEALRLKREQNQKAINVSVSRRVNIGSGDDRIGYTGNAYIPEVGMTANEYNRKIRREAVERGDIGIENIGKVGFSGRLSEKTQSVGEKKQVKVLQPVENVFIDVSSIPNQNEIYDSRTGMFISPSVTGFGATGIMRSPTPDEKSKIEKYDVLGKKVVGEIKAVSSIILPSLVLDEQIYLPDEKSRQEFNVLLEGSNKGIFSGTGGYKLSKFVSGQQEILSKDLEKVDATNKILERNPTATSFQLGGENVNIQELSNRVSSSVAVGGRADIIPTGWDILKAGADRYKAEDKTVDVLGMSVNPTSARVALKGGTEAVKVGASVLAFQLGGLALGSLGATPTITGSARALKTLKWTSRASTGVLGGSIMAGAGVREYAQSGDLGYALGAGVGSGIGFFGGIYSKQIVEGAGKGTKAGIKFIDQRIVGDPSRFQGRFYSSTGLIPQSQYAGEVVEVFYKGKWVKMELARAKALGLSDQIIAQSRQAIISDYKYYPKDWQVDYIKKAFKGRVYLDRQSLNKDLLQATKFLSETGVGADKAKIILKGAFPDYFANLEKSTVIQSVTSGGKIRTISIERPDVLRSSIFNVETKPIQLPNQRQVFQSQSVWAGTGQYERTGQDILTIPQQITSQNSFSAVGETSWVTQSTFQDSLSDSSTLQATATILSLRSRQKSRQQQKSLSLLDMKTNQQTKQDTKQDTKQISLSLLDMRQKARQDIKQITRQITKPTINKKKIGEGGSGGFGGGGWFSSSKSKSKPTQKKKGEGDFAVFVTKGGEDIKIGNVETLGEAKTKLKIELKETLRAGGFIEKGGKKLSFGEVGITDSSFRKGKRDSFRIIEKKSRRLKKGTQEVPEIIKSRKGKRKSKSRFL